MSRAAVILQARMRSTRLPGKALAALGGSTVVGHCLDRLLAEARWPVVLATTTSPEDDVLQAEADRRGVTTVRGPVRDVLARFVMAAEAMDARAVVRATADNPCIDIEGPARALRLLAASGADYATEAGLPHGAGVEAFTMEALLRAHRLAADASDREHVTPFIRRERGRFRVVDAPAPQHVRRPTLRLTIDTVDDLAFVRALWARTNCVEAEPPLERIIEAADAIAHEAAA